MSHLLLKVANGGYFILRYLLLRLGSLRLTAKDGGQSQQILMTVDLAEMAFGKSQAEATQRSTIS